MTTRTSLREPFDLLCREIDRLFPAPSREAELLARPVAELRRMLESNQSADAGPALDGLEDLLEALMHAAGWPSSNAAGERGRTT